MKLALAAWLMGMTLASICGAGERPTPDNIAAARSYRTAIDAALRAEKQASSAKERRDALQKLAELGRDVLHSSSLIEPQKSVLLEPLRTRLKTSKVAQERLAAAEKRAKNVQIPNDRGGILAQPGAGAADAGQKPADHGEDLADLIQEVISPATWERNGGPGVIKYFPNRQALIVRAPGDTHADLADLLR